MRALVRWTTVLTIAAAWSPSFANIQVLKSNGTAVPTGAATVSQNLLTGGWNITLEQLYAPGLDTVFEVHADAGEIIDNVYINVNGPASGSPVIVRLLGDAPGYLRTVRNIVQNGSAETILNKVIVTEDIGSVQVEAIGDLIAGRDVLGPIVATTLDNSVRGISNLKAGRNILGNISAESGRILLISAPQGTIGAAGAPVTIRAKYSIYDIEAKSVYADINTRVNGGTGGIFALDVQRFIGTLTAEQLIYNPWLSMDGLIYITDQFAGSITLGKSLVNATQYIQVPPSGLTGQIIINADNAPGGAWSAPVRIGPQGNPNQIVLNNPNYAQLPSVLGGGSVGLVPFRLHNQACVPANGTTVQVAPNGPPLMVQLRHYGPVIWGEGAVPVTIERRTAGSAQAFAAVPSSDFVIAKSISSDNTLTVTAASGRPGFAADYEYRIRPSTQLRCDVPSTPPVVWTTDYSITVIRPPCVGDVNGDAVVNVTDLLLVVSTWGPTIPGFPAPDINHDGQVNVSDLLAVIAHWGSCG